jgi:hypothetical protein
MNKIWFVEPTFCHDNFGIMAEGDKKFIKRIDRIANREFCPWRIDEPNYDEKKSWGAFHQGSSNDWTYWEFWADKTPEFRAKVMAKIESIKVELEGPDEFEWMDE